MEIDIFIAVREAAVRGCGLPFLAISQLVGARRGCPGLHFVTKQVWELQTRSGLPRGSFLLGTGAPKVSQLAAPARGPRRWSRTREQGVTANVREAVPLNIVCSRLDLTSWSHMLPALSKMETEDRSDVKGVAYKISFWELKSPRAHGWLARTCSCCLRKAEHSFFLFWGKTQPIVLFFHVSQDKSPFLLLHHTAESLGSTWALPLWSLPNLLCSKVRTCRNMAHYSLNVITSSFKCIVFKLTLWLANVADLGVWWIFQSGATWGSFTPFRRSALMLLVAVNSLLSSSHAPVINCRVTI